MAPTSSLQERIRQFEAMNGGAGVQPFHNGDRPRPSYPPVPRVQASFINPEASSPMPDLLGEPISPTTASYTVIKPTLPYVPRKPRIKSPSPSPPNLGCNTSLIDLKDSTFDDRPELLKESKSAVAPPLPPRISSQNSGASTSTSRSWSSQNASPGVQSRSSSNSLTVEHTYPPLRNGSSYSNLRQRQGHVPASSTSSFHSVSLSSDGDGVPENANTSVGDLISNHIAPYPVARVEIGAGREADRDRDSIDDSFSFETVSSTDVASPTLSSTNEWEKDFASFSVKPEPPKLPSRRLPLGKPPSSPSSLNSPISSPSWVSQNTSPVLSPVRRVPPPPPPPPSRTSKPPAGSSRASVMSTATTTSDRSSLFSNGTVTTAHTSIGSCNQLLRPTPVPLVARKRYEVIFFANVNAQRRVKLKNLSLPGAAGSNPASPTIPRKGWRGVSVDLVTNPEEHPLFSTSGDDEENNRLEGQVVKTIWSRSRLLPDKLRDIWNECTLPGQTSLDKDGFVKGTWRIDEELRRVQSMRSSTMTMTRNS